MAEPATAGTEVPHDAGHKKAFPPLDPETFAPQLIWLALTFVVLYVLLSRLVLPRIGEVLEERRDRIKRDLDSAEHLKRETETALAAYDKALSEARASASSIAREKRAALAAEVEKERTAVEAKLSAKLGEAEASIAATKGKALASVSTIAVDTVAAIVKQLVGEDVSPDEVKRALGSAASK